jgi:hypothetical protein
LRPGAEPQPPCWRELSESRKKSTAKSRCATKATAENRREILRCAQDHEFEQEHGQECPPAVGRSVPRINGAGTRRGLRFSSRIRRCAKMTIRECDLRFAHTDAAFPRTSSRNSRCASHDSVRSVVELRTAYEFCAADAHTAEALE